MSKIITEDNLRVLGFKEMYRRGLAHFFHIRIDDNHYVYYNFKEHGQEKDNIIIESGLVSECTDDCEEIDLTIDFDSLEQLKQFLNIIGM